MVSQARFTQSLIVWFRFWVASNSAPSPRMEPTLSLWFSGSTSNWPTGGDFFSSSEGLPSLDLELRRSWELTGGGPGRIASWMSPS